MSSPQTQEAMSTQKMRPWQIVDHLLQQIETQMGQLDAEKDASLRQLLVLIGRVSIYDPDMSPSASYPKTLERHEALEASDNVAVLVDQLRVSLRERTLALIEVRSGFSTEISRYQKCLQDYEGVSPTHTAAGSPLTMPTDAPGMGGGSPPSYLDDDDD